MQILMRGHKNEKWQLVQSAAYANETELQKLLFEQPSLISVNEVRAEAGTLVATVREFPLDVGSIDLIGFTANGDIAVIECKLATNTEVKRKVIGQVFEYGASLWGLDYEELDRKIQQRTNHSLADFVRNAVGEPEWEEEMFRINVENGLQSGNFILIIVVDEINEELSRIVRFINDAGKPAFSLAALEMRRFQKEQTEILAPHLFGAASAPKQPPSGQRSRWTEQRFFEVASAALPAKTVAIIQDLYAWSKNKSRRVWFGNGVETGSFTFHYEDNGKNVSMFSVYTNGRITVNFGYLMAQVDGTAIQKFHQSITVIPGFGNIPADFNKWPSLRIEDVFLNKPDALVQFKAAIEEFSKYLPKQS